MTSLPDPPPFMKPGALQAGSGKVSPGVAERHPLWQRWSEGIARQHGRKWSMVAHYCYLLAHHAGFDRNFRRIDWSRIDRLVFVCMGNICRSPYAEALALAGGASAVSAGLGTRAGVPAHPDAVRNAEQRGIDLRQHTARRVDDLNINGADLLVVMEPPQAWQLERNPRMLRSGAQVTLLGIWGAPVVPYIADPFGCGDDYFQTCYRRIDTGVAAILARFGR